MSTSSTIRRSTYTWDFENRLSSVTLPGGGTETFRYDPFGRRIQKIWPNAATNSTMVRNYLYDGANIVTELNASGAVVASYTQGAGIDEPLAMRRGGYISYYHADGLGSVTSLTNTSAQPVATYAYDSFGNTTATEGIFNPFRYTGREQDPETGLYYYRARYYDPQIGRFLSEDPARFWGGIDFYKYVDNSPTNAKDPSGKVKIWGNWCGPNWTGGRKEQYDPAHDSLYAQPDGYTDEICRRHDICYYQCRRDNKCSKTGRQNCMKQCDSMLINELVDFPSRYESLADASAGYIVTEGIAIDQLVGPDAGDNDKSCGCTTH